MFPRYARSLYRGVIGGFYRGVIGGSVPVSVNGGRPFLATVDWEDRYWQKDVEFREERKELRQERQALMQAHASEIKRLTDSWEKQEIRLQLEVARAQAQTLAVVQTRVLVGWAAVTVFPLKTPTEATKELTKLVKSQNNKLSVEAKQWLDDLSGGHASAGDEQAVCKEMIQIYHQLSKDVHYIKDATPGLYIGADHFPTRAASAIHILKAQNLGTFTQPVYYCDVNYDPVFELLGGKVSPVT